MKSEKVRRAELEGVGGQVSNARRAGATLTARIRFSDKAEQERAAFKLRGFGWGVSVDGATLRCLVVVA